MSDVNEAGMREYGRCSACNRYFPASDDLHDVLREHAKTCAELAAQDRAARLRAAAPEMLELLGELEFANIEHSCSGTGFCPLCGEHHEHAPDCRLSALLKRLA